MDATTDGPPVMHYTVTIPPQLRTDEFRFITIPAGAKGGGNEPGWQTTANYGWNDPRLEAHLARGGNYGVFPTAGSGVVILDADDYAGCLAARLIDGLEDRTFTIETGGSTGEKRKYHFFFRCDPPFEGKFPLFDDDGNHLGELYCQHPSGAKGYVVGADSVHPSGERYRVACDRAIATVDRVEYATRLARLSRSAKRAEPEKPARPLPAVARSLEAGTISDRLGLRPALFLRPDNPVPRGDEIVGGHPVHGSETGSNLAVGPDSWYCFRCESGGGALEALAVAEGIIRCDEAGPGCLSDRAVFRAVMDALRAKGYEVDPPQPPPAARGAGALGGGEVSAVVEPEAPPAPGEKPAKKRKQDELPPFTYRHPKYGVSVDVARLADHLYETFHVVSFNHTLHIYHEGIYREDTGQIGAEIRRVVNEAGTKEQLTRIIREVVAHLHAIAPYDRYPFDQAPDRIPVENGVVFIDYESGAVTLEPHSPAYRYRYKLPITYDPAADGDAFHENVIAQYVDGDEAAALYQIPATALLQAHGSKPFKRAYILHGDANGGKSTYLEVLTAFFGRENIAGASLQQIGADRFVNGAIEGKIINACDDLEDVPLKNVGPFKTLTGMFDHTIERKHAHPYRGRITAVHVYTCNAPPEVPERFVYDDAFWVRWVYLHFENVFAVDPGFNAKWITPENLSGFLNRVILVMQLIRRNGLLVAPDASETKQAWTVAADPFTKFVNAEMRTADKEQKFPKETLLKAFIRWCEDNNIPSRKVPTTYNALTRYTFKNEFRTARVGKDWQYAARKQWNSGSQYAPGKDDEAAGENQTL